MNTDVIATDDPGSITGDITKLVKGNPSNGESVESTTGYIIAEDIDGLNESFHFAVEDEHRPINGVVSIDDKSGTWTYTPKAGYSGADTFTITSLMIKGKTTQLISLDVERYDYKAEITGDLQKDGIEDTETISGTISATDEDGLGEHPYSIEPENQANNGTAEINSSSGEWSYTPEPNFYGHDSFVVTVTDVHGGTTSQEISLAISPIDDEAIITGDISAEGEKDETIKGQLTSIDVDGLTDSTYYTITTENTPKYGTASIDSETGEWQYKASTNFQLQDSFSVTIEDDLGGKSNQDISIQLRPSLRAISEDSGGAIETIDELFSDYMAIDNNRYLDGVIITGNEADPVTEGKWQFLLTEDVTIELPEHRAKGVALQTNDQTTRSYVWKGHYDPDGRDATLSDSCREHGTQCMAHWIASHHPDLRSKFLESLMMELYE